MSLRNYARSDIHCYVPDTDLSTNPTAQPKNIGDSVRTRAEGRGGDVDTEGHATAQHFGVSPRDTGWWGYGRGVGGGFCIGLYVRGIRWVER